MRPIHRILTFTAALVLLSRGFAGAADTAPPPKKLNVLFFAVDDLKPLLGCYGADIIRTPNLDALAARGLVFKRAYCQQAVCSPSRSSLMTGRRPDSTRVYDLDTHFRTALPDIVTLPQQFKNAGYHTEAMSKVYHPGYDDAPSWSVPTWFPNGPQYGRKEDVEEVERERREAVKAGKTQAQANHDIRGLPWEDPDIPDDALPDGMTAGHAVASLQKLAGQPQPFFLAVGFIRPHLPFVAPKKYYDLYPRQVLKIADNPFPPKGVPPYAMTTSGELRQYTGIPASGPVPDEQALDLLRGYYASTSYTDALIGRVLAELDRLGLRDNTVVVVWGDHGWHLGDHGLWCKHTNFESATHAPLIVSVPGARSAGRSTDALVEFVDICPSLCEICGIDKPADIEGTSFAPLIADLARPWKKAAFSQYPRSGGIMGYTVRTNRYRYTEWLKGSQQTASHGWPTQWGEPAGVELYDEQEDPKENVNRADDPQQKARIAELKDLLHAGWKSARPPTP